MSTAQRIANESVDVSTARAEAQYLALRSDAPNCVERLYEFYDGSKLWFYGTSEMRVFSGPAA